MRVAAVLALFIPLFSLRAEDFVVASYNIENYLAEDGGNQKSDNAIEAVVEIVQGIKPDVLGIVEMGDPAMLADFQSRLKTAGLDYPYSEWVKGTDENRHLALLSRFPIAERQSRDITSFELDGKLQHIGRGILDVTIQVNPGYRLRLVGAHLKSQRSVPDYDERLMRAKEAWFIRRHLSDILSAAPDANLLLFGDLNDTKNEYPIRELIGSAGSAEYMRDLTLKDSHGEKWTHYWKAADLYSRIDYFLVSPGLAREIIAEKSGIGDPANWNQASDHRPIFTTISATDKTSRKSSKLSQE